MWILIQLDVVQVSVMNGDYMRVIAYFSLLYVLNTADVALTDSNFDERVSGSNAIYLDITGYVMLTNTDFNNITSLIKLRIDLFYKW